MLFKKIVRVDSPQAVVVENQRAMVVAVEWWFFC
jgi:hypothetical protein